MAGATLYPDWREKVVYGRQGPQPQLLLNSDKVKVIVVGLEPGARIPAHPEVQGIYHILEGKGWMTVDGERLEVDAGATVMVPPGASRGIEAESRLAFLAVRIS